MNCRRGHRGQGGDRGGRVPNRRRVGEQAEETTGRTEELEEIEIVQEDEWAEQSIQMADETMIAEHFGSAPERHVEEEEVQQGNDGEMQK